MSSNAVYLELRYPITLTVYHGRDRLGLGMLADFSAGYRAGSGVPTVLRSETPQRITSSPPRGYREGTSLDEDFYRACLGSGGYRRIETRDGWEGLD